MQPKLYESLFPDPNYVTRVQFKNTMLVSGVNYNSDALFRSISDKDFK